jgi:eukaryotic-like serine/threonine-protein kinase
MPSGSAMAETPTRIDDANFEREARRLLDAADTALSDSRGLRAVASALERGNRELAASFAGWQPLDEKGPLIGALEAHERAQEDLGTALGRTLGALIEAMRFAKDETEVRTRLASYFWDQLLVAEADGDLTPATSARELFERYATPEERLELDGPGTLSVRSDPNATVELFRFVQQGWVLVETPFGSLGTSPIEAFSLPPGSYLAVLTADGFPPVRAPVLIRRSMPTALNIRLYTAEAIGPDFIHIPRGTFIQGGDPKTEGWGHPRSEPFVDDFFIARFPVTLAEYMDFINDVAARDFEEARRRLPRRYPDRGEYLTAADGRFGLPEGTHGWDPRFPVFGVSWFDAMAYAEWRSSRDGRQYRLPSEVEWEKAARGVDGRWHPWGDRFDPALCNMRESRREGPGPVVVDAFPTDVSVYGVRGMAGNVRDWTSTTMAEGVVEHDEVAELGYRRWRDAHDTRVVRGGAWSPLIPRVTDRYWLDPSIVLGFIGFRLAHSGPEEPGGATRSTE